MARWGRVFYHDAFDGDSSIGYNEMDMKFKLPGFASLLVILALWACASPAQTPARATPPQGAVVAEEPPAEVLPPAVEPSPTEAEEAPFDPSTISKEVFDTTKMDVQALIGRLNGIIRGRDFNTWVTYLGPSYQKSLSDPEFLKRISESTVLRKQGVVLKELKDYFTYVVVPSRANDHVDDIEFIGQNRVKAFTVDAKGRRLRLYDLEKAPSGWKIVN